MRNAPKSEQEKQEIEASDRRDRRKGGFSLMSARDRGWVKFDNGAVMTWYVEPENRSDGMVYDGITDGFFAIHIGKEKRIFDKEDFMRWLRWV